MGGAARASEEGVERLGVHTSARKRQGTRQQPSAMVGTRSGAGGHVAATRRPFRHYVEHAASNGVTRVGARLSRIWAELGDGPITKFAYHMMLYDFCLSVIVIRALD
jgi:hypothetical protein